MGAEWFLLIIIIKMLNTFRQSMFAVRSCRVMGAFTQRTYLAELGLDSNAIATREAEGRHGSELSLWKA